MSHQASRSYVARLLRERGLGAKKGLGQNFLVDQKIVRRILDCAALTGDSWVLEIGPGLGALTSGLAARAALVVAGVIVGEVVAVR